SGVPRQHPLRRYIPQCQQPRLLRADAVAAQSSIRSVKNNVLSYFCLLVQLRANQRIARTSQLNASVISTTTTVASLARVLIQKFDDVILARVHFEPLHLDLDLPRCKAFLDLYPVKLSDHVRWRPRIDP